jgi:hypothetical protein
MGYYLYMILVLFLHAPVDNGKQQVLRCMRGVPELRNAVVVAYVCHNDVTIHLLSVFPRRSMLAQTIVK